MRGSRAPPHCHAIFFVERVRCSQPGPIRAINWRQVAAYLRLPRESDLTKVRVLARPVITTFDC